MLQRVTLTFLWSVWINWSKICSSEWFIYPINLSIFVRLNQEVRIKLPFLEFQLNIITLCLDCITYSADKSRLYSTGDTKIQQFRSLKEHSIFSSKCLYLYMLQEVTKNDDIFKICKHEAVYHYNDVFQQSIDNFFFFFLSLTVGGMFLALHLVALIAIPQLDRDLQDTKKNLGWQAKAERDRKSRYRF